MIKVLKHTKDIHPSHIAKGYFIIQVGDFYYTACKSLILDGWFKEYKDAVESLDGKL